LVGFDVVGDLPERDEHGRVGAEPATAVDGLGELAGGLQAGATPGGGDALVDLAGRALALAGERIAELRGVESGVPDVERALPGEVAHRRAVGSDDGAGEVADGRVGELAIAPGDGEAGCEAQQIPLPGPGRVSSKSLRSNSSSRSGRGEDAEVAEVGVAAELDAQARGRDAGEVGRHDGGGAPVERERAHRHAGVAQWDETGDAIGVLRSQYRHGIGSSGGRLPVGDRRPRRLAAGRSPGFRRGADSGGFVVACMQPGSLRSVGSGCWTGARRVLRSCTRTAPAPTRGRHSVSRTAT
jgi:hypothetical protein